MKVKGLDGKEYKLSLMGYRVKNDEDRPRSQYHKRARLLLKQIFGLDPILEEVHLPGSYGLYADFYLPRRDMIVEVHGEQHYSFSKQFHKDPAGFRESKKRDQNKIAWCELNGLHYVELPYSEDNHEWNQRIVGGLGE